MNLFFGGCGEIRKHSLLHAHVFTLLHRARKKNLQVVHKAAFSCHVGTSLSCHVMTCHEITCHDSAWHDMPCHGMMCHGMPCHVMSWHVMSYYLMICHFITCHMRKRAKRHVIDVCGGVAGPCKHGFLQPIELRTIIA